MMTMPNITGRPLTPATIFGQPEPVCYEASTLGFKPGSWPRFVQWKGQRWTATSRVMDEGELAGVYYVNPASARMLIVND